MRSSSIGISASALMTHHLTGLNDPNWWAIRRKTSLKKLVLEVGDINNETIRDGVHVVVEIVDESNSAADTCVESRIVWSNNCGGGDNAWLDPNMLDPLLPGPRTIDNIAFLHDAILDRLWRAGEGVMENQHQQECQDSVGKLSEREIQEIEESLWDETPESV